jgi:peptidylprolyl isomerase
MSTKNIEYKTRSITMTPIKNGDTVKVHYKGTLEDGTIFDDSEDHDPLEFVIGEQMVLPGFENALIGKEIGDEITIKIPAEEAYGEYDEENQQEFEKAELDLDKYEEGMQLIFQQECDHDHEEEEEHFDEIRGEIIEVRENSVIIDFNHPLAGQNLQFWIKIVDNK